MKNTFYLLLFWLGLSLEVPAQAIWSADFPFAGELPSNEMTELYQDEDGFVWIGTTNGLSRYDGYRLQTFQTDYLHPNRLNNVDFPEPFSPLKAHFSPLFTVQSKSFKMVRSP